MKRESPNLPAVLAAGLTVILLLGLLSYAYYQSTRTVTPVTPLTSLRPLTNSELAETVRLVFRRDRDVDGFPVDHVSVSCAHWRYPTPDPDTRVCQVAYRAPICVTDPADSTQSKEEWVVKVHGHAYSVIQRRAIEHGECPKVAV